MINNNAFRVNAACPDARIATFVEHAYFIAGTISINYTFRSTASIRVSKVFRYACANSIVALSVLAAR